MLWSWQQNGDSAPVLPNQKKQCCKIAWFTDAPCISVLWSAEREENLIRAWLKYYGIVQNRFWSLYFFIFFFDTVGCQNSVLHGIKGYILFCIGHLDWTKILFIIEYSVFWYCLWQETIKLSVVADKKWHTVYGRRTRGIYSTLCFNVEFGSKTGEPLYRN
jgi:hypothetical protein